MKLHYNATGPDRKELVAVISKTIGMKPVYKGMPTCAYAVNNILVEKDGTVVYDDIADGRIYFQIDALPGTYDVTVSGNGATGWMTVFSTSAEELSAQEESLGEALEQIDPSVLSNN